MAGLVLGFFNFIRLQLFIYFAYFFTQFPIFWTTSSALFTLYDSWTSGEIWFILSICGYHFYRQLLAKMTSILLLYFCSQLTWKSYAKDKKIISFVHKTILSTQSITLIKRIYTETHLRPKPASRKHPKHE